MKPIPCFVAIRGRGLHSERSFLPDGHGGRSQGSGFQGLSRTATTFIDDKLRQVPSLANLAQNVPVAMQNAAQTEIVGLLLLGPRLDADSRLAPENFDPEQLVWHELEKQIRQRVGFRVMQSHSFREG